MDETKNVMDGTKFAYMTPPSVRKVRSHSEITWLPSTTPCPGGASGAACDHEKDEAGCIAGHRCTTKVNTTGTPDDPSMNVQEIMTAMFEREGSTCLPEAECDKEKPVPG